jgi:hypothetical protein
VNHVPAWARDERPEMISNNMVMKSFNSSYITKDVNKNYPIKRRMFKASSHVSRENRASQAPIGLKNQQN